MKQINSAITTSPKEAPTKTGTQLGAPGSATPAGLTARGTPSPTPELTKQLSPEDIAAHRAKIASEVRVVLSAYFQPSETEQVRLAQMSWWSDTLEDWSLKQVVYALRKWNIDNPRLRPTPGDILKLLKTLRGKKEAERMRENAPQVEEKKEPRITPERMQEILEEKGMTRAKVT